MNEKLRIYLLLTCIVAISFALRWWSISNNNITFWFDQSRDAFVSTQIIEKPDFKLLGPSASGTQDTVYHGVLYYYLIAPFYYFGGGNPIFPSLMLSILGSLAIIPLYFFSNRLFNSKKTALIAIILFAFSVETIQLTQWLSNPSMAVLPLIVYFWSLWEVGYKNNRKFILWMSLSLGLCLQSALWLIYLLGPLLVAITYNYHNFSKNSVFKEKKLGSIAIIFFLLITSTITLGQLMLWKNHIFSLSNLTNSENVITGSNLLQLFEVYFNKVIQTIDPKFPVISLLFILLIFNKFKSLNKDLRVFFISWFTAPFWLFLIEPRGSIHILMSIEIALILLTARVIWSFWRANNIIFKTIAGLLFIALLAGNILMVQKHRMLHSSIFSPQKGTNLSDQLILIDYTYQKANGKDFSFSTFTNPNGYYITWAYLYSWYGKNKYGYLPTFVGPNQEGLFGENLLKRDDVSRFETHFTLIEPNLDTLPPVIYDQFNSEQNSIGAVDEERNFGSTLVEYRSVYK